MKNILFILVALISSVFVSCDPAGHDDMSQPHNNSNPPVVNVTISSGGPGGSAPVTPSLPMYTAWVKYPIGIGSLALFCPHMQPTEYRTVPLNADNNLISGCISDDNRSFINTQIISQGGMVGDWALVTTVYLTCDYSAEEVVGFAPFRLMKDEKGVSKFVRINEPPVGFKEITTKAGVSAWVKK